MPVDVPGAPKPLGSYLQTCSDPALDAIYINNGANVRFAYYIIFRKGRLNQW